MRGSTKKTPYDRALKNDKSMISQWMRKVYGGNQSSWMGLELKCPERLKSLLHIAKIRIGAYCTAQRMANAIIIDGEYKTEFPFCKMKITETVEHILLDCRNWSAVR
ncbi:hypothetical protein AYI70_g5788 [Smittium culicis]|uniref:Uncharacterized protein n=1 Tax=Smittium culicis TaxID=133412 RepID=A0A1R1XSW4_9FUNG|nr:hypothetical protein AYI70_g5788 [Smittium culicis]